MPKNGRVPLLVRVLFCFTLFSSVGTAAVSSDALADARYVRAGATGRNDGSDWTNAYPKLPATLVRGATYYVADGTYSGYTFDDAESGTDLIQVKKATGSDHGTPIGWQAAYGDGRAQFGTLTFSRSYYVLDGQVGGGPPTWTSGLGFYIFTDGKGVESRIAGVSHVMIRNVEIEGHGDDAATASNDLIYLIGAHSHWTFSRLYLHDAGRTHFLWRETTDSVIEWSYMARNESTPEQHAEAISAFGGTARNTVRYSMWEDCEGTGVIMVAGSEWNIYGNVIFWTGNPQYGDTGNGSIGGWSGYSVSNTQVHHNTVVHGRGISSGIRFFTSGGRNTAFNNLFYDCENFNEGRSGFAGVTAGYSLIATSSGSYPAASSGDQVMALDPSLFVAASNHDYRLAMATTGGSVLVPPFDRDLLDQARGADGVWDRGAYEGSLPALSVAATDATASEPGSNTGTFVVSRSGSTSLALTVNLSVGGTAAAGQDYARLPASLTIPAGAGSASLTLTPFDDSLAESNETVSLTLAAGIGYTIGTPASASVTIADNDTVVGTGLSGTYYDNMDFSVPKLTRTDATVNFDWASGSPDPSMGIDTFSVRWTGQVQPQFSQTYTFYTRSDDGARLWVNGQLLIDKWVDQATTEWSGTIALVAGQRYDLKLEFLENVGEALVELRWSSPSTPKQIIPTSALFPPGSPVPSLPVVSVTATDATASEPGTDTGSFALTRTGSTSAPLTVNVSWGGTATGGSDYSAPTTTLTFPAGAATVPVSVVPTNDTLVEGTETVVLTVGTGAGYQVGSPASATLSITDDDVLMGTGLSGVYYDNMDFSVPKLTRTDATVNFNWASGSPDPSMGIDTFSVRWTGQVQPQFSQTYTFYTRSDDGVRLWVNGQLLIDKWVDQATTEWSGTIALVAGQRYDLKLEFLENVGEALVELRWSSPSTPKQIIPTSALFPPGLSFPLVSVAATDATASEPGSDTGSFALTRTGSTSAPLTVNVAWSGTATGGSDYSPQPTALTFPAGAATVPVSLVPTDDAVVEATESVVLTVLAGTGYTIGSQASASVTIADNDVVVGTGLSGTYYDNMDFSVPKLTRTDATVNFNWASGSPDPSMGIDTFSVRWTGQVQPQFSQTYTFYTSSDDGARLWVNGQLLIDKWVDQATTEWSGTIALVAGQKYDLKLEFLENVGEALVELRWSSPSTPKQIIPTSALFPVGPPGPSLPVVSVAATDTTASEPGTDTGSFTLTRTGSSSAPLTVNVSWGGTATGGSDYSAPPTTLTFPASAASVSASVVPTDDTLVEATETVVLAVLAGTGYEVGSPSSATVTIADNDAPLTPTRYVRAGATGTAVGTDWTNAYPQLPATLQRGVTYYLADGTYPGYTFGDAESGSDFITVKKATGSDHGTGVGWQAAYGDGQAELGAVTFARSYYAIDGQIGGGPSQWTTGHGIKLRGTAANEKIVRVGAGTTPSEAVHDIRLAHVELVHRGRNTETSDDGLYGFYARNISLSHCYLHDLGRAPILMREWNGMTVEYCYIARNSSSPANHSEGVSDSGSDNVTFRHVVWKDIEGTAIISTMERGSSAENWTIYGNVVFYSSQYGAAPNDEGISGFIEVLNDSSNSAIANNWKIYNNTLVNVPGLWSGIRIDAGTGNVARNNLWYNSVRTAHHRIDISHSWYFNTVQDGDVSNAELGAGNPFVNLAGEDFHLGVPTLPGVSLGAPYDVDPDGIKRGADGNWDRGAFEVPR